MYRLSCALQYAVAMTIDAIGERMRHFVTHMIRKWLLRRYCRKFWQLRNKCDCHEQLSLIKEKKIF